LLIYCIKNTLFVCVKAHTLYFLKENSFVLKYLFVFRNICKYICLTAGDLNVIKIVTGVKNSSVFNIKGEFMSIDVV